MEHSTCQFRHIYLLNQGPWQETLMCWRKLYSLGCVAEVYVWLALIDLNDPTRNVNSNAGTIRKISLPPVPKLSKAQCETVISSTNSPYDTNDYGSNSKKRKKGQEPIQSDMICNLAANVHQRTKKTKLNSISTNSRISSNTHVMLNTLNPPNTQAMSHLNASEAADLSLSSVDVRLRSCLSSLDRALLVGSPEFAVPINTLLGCVDQLLSMANTKNTNNNLDQMCLDSLLPDSKALPTKKPSVVCVSHTALVKALRELPPDLKNPDTNDETKRVHLLIHPGKHENSLEAGEGRAEHMDQSLHLRQRNILERVHCPDLYTFQRAYFSRQVPVILTGVMKNWPAMGDPFDSHDLHPHPKMDRNPLKCGWRDLDYFKTIAGRRTIPVELGKLNLFNKMVSFTFSYPLKLFLWWTGRSYMASDWEQRLMSMDEFIDRFLMGDLVPSAGAGQKRAKVGYLAQHELFKQVILQLYYFESLTTYYFVTLMSRYRNLPKIS